MATQVFKEASKAETKLKLIRKTCDRRVAEVEKFYEEKTQKFIASLDPQVRSALRGAGVLEWEGAEKPPGIDADGTEAAPEAS